MDVIKGTFPLEGVFDGSSRFADRGQLLLEARRWLAAEVALAEAWCTADAAPPALPEGPLVELRDRVEALERSATSALPLVGAWTSGSVELARDPARLRFLIGQAGACAEAWLGFGDEDAVSCACAAPGCSTAELALRAFLDLAREPSSDERERLLSLTGPPAWRQLLDRLTDEDDEDAASDDEEKLAWRVMVAGASVTVEPVPPEGAPDVVAHLEELCDGGPPDRDVARRLLEAVEAERAGFTDLAERRCRDALALLVDHPRVLLDVGGEARPLCVSRAPLELLVEERADGALSLSAGVEGVRIAPEALLAARDLGHAVLVEGARCLLVPLARDLVPVLEALLELPASFPRGARAELLRRLPALERRLPVRLPPSLEGPPIAADARLHVRLTPRRQGGVVAELGFRPVAAGPFFVPGEGPLRVPGVAAERRVLATRDPEQERSLAREVAGVLPLGQLSWLSPFVWTVPTGDRALELLSALRALASGRDDVVVEWPKGAKAFSVTRAAEPSDLRASVREGRDWFRVDGMLRVDEHEVGLDLLLEAARERRAYIPLAGGRFVSLSDALRERLSAMADLFADGEGDLRLAPDAVPLFADLLDDDALETTTDRFRELTERARRARSFAPEVPRGVTTRLRSYQEEGFRWMARLAAWGAGACLADDMGLGKTLQALTMLVHRERLGPALVVAPTSLCFNWQREAKKHAPGLKTRVYRSDQKERLLSRLGPRDVLIVSYGLLTRDIDSFEAVEFSTVVLDEAQALKNPGTRRTRAVRRLNAAWTLALSGTPVENHLGELWSLLSITNPGLLGSHDQFRRRFALPIERVGDAARREALARLIRPFVLRRVKRDVAPELPSRTEIVLRVELSKPERTLYEAARRRAVDEVSHLKGRPQSQQDRFLVLAAITRLRQLACHPRLADPSSDVSSSKLNACLERVRDLLDGGHRALVFSQFTQHLALLRERLDDEGIAYTYLDGTTPAIERQRRVEAFQSGEGALFLISLKAGGTGLTLTEADYVIHLDPWWNPAVEDQATDRAHRIGQRRPVTVYRLVSAGTIEERIVEMHGDKRELAAGLLGEPGAPSLDGEILLSLLEDAGDVAEELEEEADPRRAPQRPAV